jgi:DNA-binding SARP family transcriptional activator/Tfp pilus assembly protein PilF
MHPDVEYLLIESRAKELKGDLASALNRAQTALERAQDISGLEDQLAILLHQSRLHERLGNYDQAQETAQQVLQDGPARHSAVDALVILGICTAQRGDIPACEENLHRAADLSRRLDYQAGLSAALHYLALYVYYRRGQFDLALDAMASSATLAENNGSDAWGLPYLQAAIYQVINDRSRARQALDELLPMVTPSSQVAGSFYLVWARLSIDEDDLAKAHEYLHLTMQIAHKTGSADLNMWTRLEHSTLNRLQDNLPGAINWADDALSYARRMDSRYYMALARIARGYATWQAGDSASAENDLQEAISLLKPVECAYDLARAELLLAGLYHKAERPEASDTWGTAARRIERGGFGHILEHERSLAFPLVAYFMKSNQETVRQITESMLRQIERVMPLPLRVAGLGQFTVWQGRRSIPDSAWPRRKAGELFRFLLLQPQRSAPREVVTEALWPDHSPEAALALLHQSTSALRRILEPDIPDKYASRYLTVENDRVILYLPPGSATDFDQFSELLPRAIRNRNFDLLERALAMYSGDLFPQDLYADWAAAAREHLLQIYQDGLLALAEAYLSRSQYGDCLAACQRVLKLNPWSEDAVLTGMKAYTGLRDGPRAMLLYRKLERCLDEDLQMTPRSDLRALAKSIQQPTNPLNTPRQ